MTLYLTDNTSRRRDRARARRADSSTRSSTTRPARRRTPTPASRRSSASIPRSRRWSGTASCCRCTAKSPIPDVDVFDRERVFVDTHADARSCATSRRCASCSSTSRRARRPRSCATRRRHVAATITPQHLLLFAQRAVRRRPAPASLLPADPQARERTGRRWSRRRPRAIRKFFLGTDSRAARKAHEGERVRLRRLLLGAGRARAVRGSVRGRGRARPARRLREPLRRGLLRPAAQRRHGDAGARAVARCPREFAFGDETIVPLRAGETLRWRVARELRRIARAILARPKPARPSLPASTRGEESPGSTEQDAG